jgi:hypothetical protein
MEQGGARPFLGRSRAYPPECRHRHPERHHESGDATFPVAISSGFGALVAKEDVLVLLELFFVRAGTVDAFLAPRHAVHSAEARGEGGTRVHDAARAASEARQQ